MAVCTNSVDEDVHIRIRKANCKFIRYEGHKIYTEKQRIFTINVKIVFSVCTKHASREARFPNITARLQMLTQHAYLLSCFIY